MSPVNVRMRLSQNVGPVICGLSDRRELDYSVMQRLTEEASDQVDTCDHENALYRARKKSEE